MLRGRGFQSVCYSCRLNILASRGRNVQARGKAQLSQPTRLPRRSIAALGQTTSQRRNFATTSRRTQETPENATQSSQSPNDLPPTPIDRLNIEVNVRNARQVFGDALPRGHLSDEEYVVYERLYGTPIFVEKAEDLEVGAEADAEEIVEGELADGSTVLLRKREDGELEEVEYYEEPEELLEEDEDTMTAEEDIHDEKARRYHDGVYEKSRLHLEEEYAEADAEQVEDDDFMRAHPLTIAGRSKPSPSTVFLPQETLVDPTAQLLTRANHKHLAESANRIFGGRGLPFSSATPSARLGKEQKPIALDPSHADMGNIEADAYMAAVQPGTYASVMAALVEVRRRLGTSWVEHILQKKGGTVLDAGSGGVGILAWHEVLKAEWARMHEESEATSRGNAPLGKATVLTAPNTLRHRASQLLENTTFIPRLPDAVSEEADTNTEQPRKLYDLIIAPHTLWPLRQEYLRKDQVQKYWSLLNPKGGVLILVEKGLPRGFEVIAGARELLLERHIASPDSITVEASVEEQASKPQEDTRFIEKDTGMIIAPCTNHSTCPMYQSPGISLGRKDFCFFSQRYIRPPYLQRILDAKDCNHEDVQYSYLAVQRGRDHRKPLHDPNGRGIVQNEDSTNEAFEGHEWKSGSVPDSEPEPMTPADINTLTLPRLILPALKRRGHIILDVCTPAGTLERWTVPRSFSKQAFRDARKARWGDLWALGAKTRIPRNVRLGRPRDEFDKKGRRIKAPKKMVVELDVSERGDEGARVKRDGRYGVDRKIRGSGGRKGRKKAYDYGEDDL
ncbi:37S ribosomal protein-like protein Rsm22 [Lentithecium fluviatile CBS 122367]|uniref:37S ribosomal protein-like protein Rsm22 n=1 Tax=Lentithecium fluviatile CBS 122367 TaxID=1168545 RepID=A0A6G1JLS2_9PLEO|nr:37S ribosomal protein-like protein Rsm22 [Lentithecium fluviatile CBS 122367]